MAEPKQKGRMQTIRRVLRYAVRFRKHLVLSLLLAVVTVALTLLIPILVGRALDSIHSTGQVDFPAVIRVLIAAGISVLLTSAAQWGMSLLNNRMTFRIVRQIRDQAFAHLQTLPAAFFDGHPAGETVSRIISDADQFADGLLMGFTQLFTGVLTIIGTLCFMFYVHAGITLVVLLMTPLSLFAAAFIAKRTYSLFDLQARIRAEQTACIHETISGQRVIQAFSREHAVLSEFDGINERLREASQTATFYSSLTNPVTRFINALVYAAVGVTGALAAVSGRMTVGGLSCFLSYANQYTKPFNEISGVMTELQNALACADRVFALIDEPAEIPDAEDAAVLENAEGGIEFSHISFSYVPERPLIEDCSITVRPGQRVAIVGPTGCGKTTLINLIMRFYDVNSGAISADGIDIRQLTRESLRKNIGMVLQETWLAHTTVRENIRMGKPDATDEEVTAAAKSAHAHSFIRRLPQGYDTVISDRSGSLSQGQRQLLCIARLMLCLPPVLILDEATSSIDTRTELKIQSAFGKMMRGRTSFIVAHRLSTVQTADLILVMNNGSIIEQGTHESLVRQGGFYASLYRAQFEQ